MYFFDIESQLPSYNINMFIDPFTLHKNTIFNSIQIYINRLFYNLLQM
jgi:hypothetical protein